MNTTKPTNHNSPNYYSIYIEPDQYSFPIEFMFAVSIDRTCQSYGQLEEANKQRDFYSKIKQIPDNPFAIIKDFRINSIRNIDKEELKHRIS